jgi:DNA polymerase III subunit delta'
LEANAPMSFREVVGHTQATEVLRRAIAGGRVAQAYLLVGPPNVGKELVALEVAKTLNCLAPPAGGLPDSCGVCASCRKIALGSHPDVRVVRPTVAVEVETVARQTRARPAKRARKGAKPAPEEESEAGEEAAAATEAAPVVVAKVRHQMEGAIITLEYVTELISMASSLPLEGRRQAFIVRSAEAMNQESANRLLKTLEEPPGATTFILTTTNPSALLPTIISRCQNLNLHAVPAEVAIPALRATYPKATLEAVEAVYGLSGGRYGWAHALLSRPQVLEQRAALLQMAASLPQRRTFEGMRLAEQLLSLGEGWWAATEHGELAAELLKRNRDRVLRTMLGDLFDVLLTWFRDLALVAADPGSEAVINRDQIGPLREAAGAYSRSGCVQAARWISETKERIRRNANPRLSCEALMVRLIGLSGALP